MMLVKGASIVSIIGGTFLLFHASGLPVLWARLRIVVMLLARFMMGFSGSFVEIILRTLDGLLGL